MKSAWGTRVQRACVLIAVGITCSAALLSAQEERWTSRRSNSDCRLSTAECLLPHSASQLATAGPSQAPSPEPPTPNSELRTPNSQAPPLTLSELEKMA